MQLLSITCDNATVNDSMIDELVGMTPDFPERANQTCCFLHILNLIVKTVIKQFDTPRKVREGSSGEEQELADLVRGIEFEETEMQALMYDLDAESPEDDDDNVNGWIDEEIFMSDKERAELSVSLLPIQLVIAKVSSRDLQFMS